MQKALRVEPSTHTCEQLSSFHHRKNNITQPPSSHWATANNNYGKQYDLKNVF